MHYSIGDWEVFRAHQRGLLPLEQARSRLTSSTSEMSTSTSKSQAEDPEDQQFAVGRLGTEALVTTHLAKQSLENLDPSKLTPLSPEVISRQATINIGMLSVPNIVHSRNSEAAVVRKK